MNAAKHPQMAPISQRENDVLPSRSLKSASFADGFFRALVIALVLSVSSMTSAKETLVRNVAEFDATVKAARPDDKIILANGEWRDVDLVFRGEGKVQLDPDSGALGAHGWIELTAETPGQVILTGRSRLLFGGRHLAATNLLWKDVTAQDQVVAFRIDTKQLASDCFLISSAILGDLPDAERKWVSLYGRDNHVISCRFEGKQSPGTLLVVWSEDQPNRHDIANNYFGPRARLGKNGGEIIRIGDSKTSLHESATTVIANYFYHCDGEAEIISNKSCGNLYGANVFVGCGGALTLRHGHRCDVVRNAFFGDGRPGTGGIRVIGEDHRITRNLFHELTGDDARAALSLMNGIPETPANGYSQVLRATVNHNLFVNCKESIVVGLRDDDQPQQTLPPSGAVVRDNLVLSAKRPVFFLRTPGVDFTVENNRYDGDELGTDEAGWKRAKLPLSYDDFGLPEVADFPITHPHVSLSPDRYGPKWLPLKADILPKAYRTPAKEPENAQRAPSLPIAS